MKKIETMLKKSMERNLKFSERLFHKQNKTKNDMLNFYFKEARSSVSKMTELVFKGLQEVSRTF